MRSGRAAVVEDLCLIGLCGGKSLRISVWWFFGLRSYDARRVRIAEEGSCSRYSGRRISVRSWGLVVKGLRRKVLGDMGRGRVIGLPISAWWKLLGLWIAVVRVRAKGRSSIWAGVELLGRKLIGGMVVLWGNVGIALRGRVVCRIWTLKDGFVCSSMTFIWRLSRPHGSPIHPWEWTKTLSSA